jgi:hypothetical protein
MDELTARRLNLSMIACWSNTLSGLLTPLIAIISVWIAWQQWRTNHIKLQHDLFERRFAVFTALIDFLNLAIVKGEVDPGNPRWKTFHDKARESHFLFKGQDIPKYLEEVSKQVDILGTNYLKISTENLTPTERSAKLDIARQWLRNELESGANEKFAKHLRLY